MSDDTKKSLINQLTPGQTFAFGLVGGVLVLCTIGFFILLAVVMKGGKPVSFLSNTGDAANVVNGGEAPAPRNAPKLVDIAVQAGLDVDKWKSCIRSEKFAKKINDDETEAQNAGGQGTPYSIIIGPKGETIPVNGAQPYQVVEAVLAKMLGRTTNVPASALPTEQKGLKIRPADSTREDVRGNKNAKITIVEYSDFECPFCKRFHQTMQQVMQNFGNDIKWVYREFPLDGLHQQARTEAMAAECAHEQGKFWQMTDGIFQVTPSNDGMDVTL